MPLKNIVKINVYEKEKFKVTNILRTFCINNIYDCISREKINFLEELNN